MLPGSVNLTKSNTGLIFLKREWKQIALVAISFLAVYSVPIGGARFDNPLGEALRLAQWYAREHVILCLIPAFFIAGAIAVFVRQASVVKYLGAGANKVVAYGVASVSGTVLAVCSCTVLPLFAGIYKRGAGLGPASAFLYSGPAINVLAVILTARVLGLELGLARAFGAIVFSVLVGLLMNAIFRKETNRVEAPADASDQAEGRALWQEAVFFGSMVGILVFANWGASADPAGAWYFVFAHKWLVTAAFATLFAVVIGAWFHIGWWRIVIAAAPVVALALLFPGIPAVAFGAGVVGLAVLTCTRPGEPSEWLDASWGFAKQILPLLLLGVLAAGFLLGRPGSDGVIPSRWVSAAVGGNSLGANFFASVAGAFMYFATLTEVPILQGLLGAGMGKGPALALLLAGPALSLPNMIVIQSVIGWRKTAVFVSLVVVMATVSGVLFGAFFG